MLNVLLLLVNVATVFSATYTNIGSGYCRAYDAKPICNYHVGTSYLMNPYSDDQCKGFCDLYTGCTGYTNMKWGQGGCFLWFLSDATELTTYPTHLPGFGSCGAYCATNANAANHATCKKEKAYLENAIANGNTSCMRKVGAKYLKPATGIGAYNMDCIQSNPMQFAYHNSCFLNTQKELKCFGLDDKKLVTDAPTNGPFNMLTAGHSNYCVIRSADESLTCWGNDYYKVVTDTPKTGKFSSVSCGAYHCCAIYSTSKAIKCWGSDHQKQVTTAPTSGTYSRIFARGNYACAISSTADKSLTVWGHDKHIGSLISGAPAAGSYTQLSLGLYHMCAILSADQTIKCWGNNQYKNISNSPSGKFIQISVGCYYSCAIAVDHSIKCWGSNDLHNPISNAPTTGSYSLMYSGYYHLCALQTTGDKYICWGWDKHGEVSEPMKANVNIKLPSTCAVGSTSLVTKDLYPNKCRSISTNAKNLVNNSPVTDQECLTKVKADSDCWKENGNVMYATFSNGKYCYCTRTKDTYIAPDEISYGTGFNAATTCHTIRYHGSECTTDADCTQNRYQCTNGVCAPCQPCDTVDPTCVKKVNANPSDTCGCASCDDIDIPRKIGTNFWCARNVNVIDRASPAVTKDECYTAAKADSRCMKTKDGKMTFIVHTNSANRKYCICNTWTDGNCEAPLRVGGSAITGEVYQAIALANCSPSGVTALPSTCNCSANKCDAGKWCYDGTCQNTAKYPACPVSFHTSLTNECVCATETTTCALGRWCYEGSCKSTAKCAKRADNHKNLFYGAKVYGRWNATAKRMYMNFTTPWDISVGKIKWKKTSDLTMQYLKASYGLWKVDKATDPCKCTYHLDVPQTTFFGAGSNFTITGSQLRTNLRVEASENIQVVKNQQTYAYTRNIKNTVPVLVNLVTRTTIAVRFRSTAAPPGPGPAPALEDFVLFVGAEDYFATDDPHVLITMKVHSRTCVDHALPDTGVRVKTGADNIKTGSTQTFNWLKDSNGDIIAPYEHNLCVEELSWKFYPKKYKENTYEIELEFDLKNLPQKFTTIAAIDIKQADVLADIGFTSTINVYNNSNCTAESKNNKVILGHKFYTKIVLTDMVIDAKNITCNTYKIKQTKAGSTFETDMKGEVKYAFEEKHIISPTVKNSHICGAELESHHFHVSVDGYDTVLETEIEIYYDQTNSRRKLVTIPISHNMWDDEIWEAEVGMTDDGFEEVGVGAAEYDAEDKLFRETKRSPDQDDMVVNLFVETESAKGAAVGTFMDTDSTQLFLTMSLCVFLVGVIGFLFGYVQNKSSNSYLEIPDDYNSFLVEMK